jgi:uncharacterized protein (DUF2126 family)
LQGEINPAHPPLIVKQKYKIMAWTRKPQEQDGSYFFSGQFYATRATAHELTNAEILSIYNDVRAFAQEKNGIDYLQVYTNEKGHKLFFIDQLSREMIESGDYNEEDNHCTLMWAHEY